MGPIPHVQITVHSRVQIQLPSNYVQIVIIIQTFQCNSSAVIHNNGWCQSAGLVSTHWSMGSPLNAGFGIQYSPMGYRIPSLVTNSMMDAAKNESHWCWP